MTLRCRARVRLPERLRSQSELSAPAALVVEQPPFSIEPASVTGQLAVRSDDPVARDDDRDRIRAVGEPDRARGADRSDLPGDRSIRGGVAWGNSRQRRPDPALERPAAQIEDELASVCARAAEVETEPLRARDR